MVEHCKEAPQGLVSGIVAVSCAGVGLSDPDQSLPTLEGCWDKLN